MYRILTARVFGASRTKHRRLRRCRTLQTGPESLEARRLLSASDSIPELDPQPLAASAEAAKDFGDAPFPYSTSRSENGAAHLLGSDLWLGNEVDAESDGRGDWGADNDDFDGVGDEDGITLTTRLLPGQSAKLSAVASRSGRLQAWIDFNADGDWDDAGEQILKDKLVQSGINSLSFLVPSSAPQGLTYARFRISDQMGLGPRGTAINGEVEDYVVLVGDNTSEISSPLARNDQFIVQENSQASQLDVLANDQLPWIGGRITQIDTTGLRGSAAIGPGGGSLIYTPYVRYVGVETLTYAVTNLVGDSSTATVNILILDEVKPPAAEPDQFIFTNDGGRQELHVLGNDVSENGTITIVSVTKPSAGGAIAIQAEGKTLSYIPPAGFVGQDEFYYTVRDVSGLTDEARVIVDLRGDDAQLRLRLETANSSGQPVTNLRPGDSFFLNVFAQDLRPTGKGIFAAYLDVEYDSMLVVPDGSIVHSSTYSHAVSGDLSHAGQIDEAGGTDGVRPLGLSEYLLLQIPMIAVQAGWGNFTSNPADSSPEHDLLVFGSDDAVDPEIVEYGSTTLRVVQFTNDLHPLDVDANQVVAPLDALLVINELNASGPRQLSSNLPRDMIPQHAVDVNGDGFLSPLDALRVINELNAPSMRLAPSNDVASPVQPNAPSPIDVPLDTSPSAQEPVGGTESDADRPPDEAENPPVVLDPVGNGIIESFFSSYGSSQDGDGEGESLVSDLEQPTEAILARMR